MGIRLSDQRYEEIKCEVIRMFTEYDVFCVPINGFEIAHKMGVGVYPYTAYPHEKRQKLMQLSEDGFSARMGGGQPRIFYNDERSYGRVNHTMMHEIGHIVLDHTEESELAEKEAGFFAKYALAPPVLIHKLGLNRPERIAQVFDISFEAACYAYEYYKKWVRFGGRDYTDYERQLLRLFEQAG